MQESGSDLGSGASRRLVIMRHAKAEATAPSDHERALAARGRAEAQEAGRWLREQGIVPDVAVTLPTEPVPGEDPALDKAVEILGKAGVVGRAA